MTRALLTWHFSPSAGPGATLGAMGLAQTLDETLKQAIRKKDTRTADVVRMIKRQLVERRTAKGVSGEIDDAPVLDAISAYRKQPQRAPPEDAKLVDRRAAARAHT